MKKKDLLVSYIKRCLPYLVLILINCISCELLFYKGVASGDDVKFHFANIYDLYLALKEGKSLVISSTLINGLGYGKGLFYSPLSHFSVAFIALILEPFNITMMQAYKITIFTSIFVSGIFMYRFSMHITKGKRVISILVGSMYILCPYRLFNYFARLAFAEGYAALFMPLFFMGLFDLTHNKKTSMKPFVEIVLGGALTYLSHNITGLYLFTFGIIYLLFFSKDLFIRLKNSKRLFIYSILSCIILVGLISIIFLPSLSLLKMNIYNVSISERMWTTYSHVSSDTARTIIYTGFLNLSWLNSNGITYNDVFLMIIYLFLITLLYFICDKLLQKIKKIDNYHILISSLIYLAIGIPLGIFYSGKEFSLTVLSISILFISLTYLDKFLYKHLDNTNDNKHIYTNRFIYAISTLAIISLIFVSVEIVWKIVPSIYYTIQFAWRLNGFVYLFVNILFAVLLDRYAKEFFGVSVIAVGTLPMFSQALVEKRIIRENLDSVEDYDYDSSSSSWRYEIDSDYATYTSAIGANREYLPYIYYYTAESNYTPTYSDTLYYNVRNVISGGNIDLEAIALDGKASISDYYQEAPKVSFNLNVVSDSALIQVPLIYYPGYTITLTNTNTFDTYEVSQYNVSDVDYLVAFEASCGQYLVSIDYTGNSAVKCARNMFGLSFIGLYLLIIVDFTYQDKKKYTTIVM